MSPTGKINHGKGKVIKDDNTSRQVMGRKKKGSKVLFSLLVILITPAGKIMKPLEFIQVRLMTVQVK